MEVRSPSSTQSLIPTKLPVNAHIMNVLIPSTARKPPAQLRRDHNLLPFPPEIRTIIYKYVLTSITPFVRNRNSSSTTSQQCHHHPSSTDTIISYPCSNIHSALDLSLLLVSRHTYFETFHMYYALNTIHLCSTGRLFYFLTRIGYARRQQLVSIAFHIFDNDAKRAFLVLRTAKRLQHLKFHLPRDLQGQDGYFAVPGIAALREVRGLSHVEITSSHDCSDLIASMMRPRLSRYTLKATDKEVEFFKQPREHFPKTEAQRLRIGMNWMFGTTLCVSCKKSGSGSCKPEENGSFDHSCGMLVSVCAAGCVYGRKLWQGELRRGYGLL